MRDNEIKRLLKPDKDGFRKYTLEQVAAMFGITRQRVSQINGNVGRYDRIERLKSHLDEIRRSLFFDESTTLEQVSKEYRLAIITLKQIIGSRNSYEVSIGLRKCNRCKEILPIGTFYHNGNTSIDRCCPKCANERHHEWQVENREHVNAYMRDYNKTPQRKKYIKEYRRTR